MKSTDWIIDSVFDEGTLAFSDRILVLTDEDLLDDESYFEDGRKRGDTEFSGTVTGRHESRRQVR